MMCDIERIAFMTGVSNEAHEDPDGLAASMHEVYEVAREMLGHARDPFFANRLKRQVEIFDEMWSNPLAPSIVMPEPPMEDG